MKYSEYELIAAMRALDDLPLSERLSVMTEARRLADTNASAIADASGVERFRAIRAHVADYLKQKSSPKSPPPIKTTTVNEIPTPMTQRLTQQDIDKIVADAKAAREAHENDGLSQEQVDRLERFDRENGLGDHATMCIASDPDAGTQVCGISVADAKKRGMKIDKILKGGAR